MPVKIALWLRNQFCLWPNVFPINIDKKFRGSRIRSFKTEMNNSIELNELAR